MIIKTKIATWITFLVVLFAILLVGYPVAVKSWYKAQYTVAAADASAPQPVKILLVWYRGIGEQETIERLKIASKRIGVDLRVATTGPKFYIRKFVKDPIGIARDNFKPDFILTIQDWLEYYPGVPNYMTLTLGTERYLTNDQHNATIFANPEHAKFDALLPSFKDIEQLQTTYEQTTGKKFLGFAWYPTAYITEYKPAIATKLFYSGGFLWDETRGSQKYKELFTLLDRTGYFSVCGPKRKWKHTPDSAIGFIPVDGVSLLEAHHRAGVSLLLHHQLHLNGAAPTGRIFEAAAANTVIISDQHPFIMQHFGDNVLYVDTQQDAAGIFKQIDDHMTWIRAHPAEAQQMADNCHAINAQKFSLEAQLQKLIAMHQNASQ